MVNFKEIYHFSRFQRESNIFHGGPTFSRGEGGLLIIFYQLTKSFAVSCSRRLYAYAHVMNYFSVFLDSVDSDQTGPIDEQSDLVLHRLLYTTYYLLSADQV